MQAAERAKNVVFVPGDLGLWPWPSNSSEWGTNHFPSEYSTNPFSGSWDTSYKQKSHRLCQKQNLMQFTACGNCLEK